METQELKDRWIHLLRIKAEQYEHTIRKAGGTVTGPSLDDICNEIDAFFTGLNH